MTAVNVVGTCPRCRGRIGGSGYGSCYCSDGSSAGKTGGLVKKDGIFSLSVTSDGTTGEDWAQRLKSNKFAVTSTAEGLLKSIDFRATSGVTSEVVILREKNVTLPEWTFLRLCDAALKIGLRIPDSDVACLMREKLSDQEVRNMGLLAVVVAHPPIFDNLWSKFGLLGIDCHFNRCLCAEYRHGTVTYGSEVGFAFVM